MHEMSFECYQLCVCTGIDLIMLRTQRQHLDLACKITTVRFNLKKVWMSKLTELHNLPSSTATKISWLIDQLV